jgi:TonB-linked SusC/RagA family outer membrane protein
MQQRVVGTGVRSVALAALAGASLGALPAAAAAQVAPPAGQTAPESAGVIRGTVTETGTQRPLSGVQLVVVGTRLGGVTSAAGEFTIAGVPAGEQTVRVRRIGYAPVDRAVSVTAGAPAQLDVALAQSATELDRVVVTGTAGPVEKRAIGNAVSQINVEELSSKSTVANVTDVLQGKTPGVTLVPGSGTPGTAADIRIRGTSSLVGSNRPIFYVDGIRYYDGQQGNLNASGNGISNAFSQATSAIDAINPEDIESVEVIKGPAAATLYGADAAGGVIQIITKKGARGSQRASWNAKAESGYNDFTLEWPTNYTTCTAARLAPGDTITTGAQRGQPNWPGCVGQTPGAVITGNPLRDDPAAFRRGVYRNFVGSVRGGSERASYYLSADRSFNEGIYYNSYDNKRGARGNFGYAVNDKLDFTVQASYIQNELRLPYESEGALGLIISGVRGEPGNARNEGSGWRFQTPDRANIYDNETEAERTLLGGTVNFVPVSWFRNRATFGVDFNSPLATVFYPPNVSLSADADPTFAAGVLVQQQRPTHLYTFDYSGTASNTIPVLGGLRSDFSLGVQGVLNQVRFTQARGDGLPSEDFQLVGSATTRSGTTDFSEQSSLGYYVQEQVGYANRLFLTGALRADDNSAFGTRFDRVYYPKASLSYVVSEEPALSGIFEAARADNLRLRFAYGQAGRAPGPYDAARTYTATRVVNGAGAASSGLVAGAPGNANLKPERGTEFEAGFDASFLRNRVSLEFTGYGKRTTDALLSLSAPPSSGFTASQFINFGAIRNTGTETALRVQPVASRPLTLDLQFNYTTNRNTLTKLNRPGISSIGVSNVYSGTGSTQQVREGYPVAGFWAVDARRTESGALDTTAAGAVQPDVARYIGPATPTREATFSTTFTILGNLRLYALADYHAGHYLFNARDRQRSLSGVDARQNDPAIAPVERRYYATSSIIAPWVQPADYAKLRDVSVSYTLPAGLSRIGRLENATVTVAGHNLGFLYKKYPGIDPEVSYVGQGTFLVGRADFLNFTKIDSYATPMTQRVTASLNLNF